MSICMSAHRIFHAYSFSMQPSVCMCARTRSRHVRASCKVMIRFGLTDDSTRDSEFKKQACLAASKGRPPCGRENKPSPHCRGADAEPRNPAIFRVR